MEEPKNVQQNQRVFETVILIGRYGSGDRTRSQSLSDQMDVKRGHGSGQGEQPKENERRGLGFKIKKKAPKQLQHFRETQWKRDFFFFIKTEQ